MSTTCLSLKLCKYKAIVSGKKTMRSFSFAADISKALDSFIQHLIKPPLFRLTKLGHQKYCPPYLMFELTSYQSPLKGLPSSRAPFEPIEKRKMKFRWISSNSRGLSSTSSYILLPNRRYVKGRLMICFVAHMKRASNQVGER